MSDTNVTLGQVAQVIDELRQDYPRVSFRGDWPAVAGAITLHLAVGGVADPEAAVRRVAALLRERWGVVWETMRRYECGVPGMPGAVAATGQLQGWLLLLTARPEETPPVHLRIEE